MKAKEEENSLFGGMAISSWINNNKHISDP